MNYIDKWDGKLPTVVSGESGSMMIDISSLLKQVSSAASTAPAQRQTVQEESIPETDNSENTAQTEE